MCFLRRPAQTGGNAPVYGYVIVILAYPFSPPTKMPLTKWRCRNG